MSRLRRVRSSTYEEAMAAVGRQEPTTVGRGLCQEYAGKPPHKPLQPGSRLNVLYFPFFETTPSCT